MAYELWVSPETGYRRQGTRLAELTAIFEKQITVASIVEPLLCCRDDDSRNDVVDEMDRLGFDLVGVMDSTDESIKGYFSQHDGEQEQQLIPVVPFKPSQLISDSTPLADVLGTLHKAAPRFVVTASGVTGIVTLADLQKPIVRVLMFGIVSLLELHLSFWILQDSEGGAWRGHLSNGRLEKAQTLLKDRRAKNEDISEFDCLQFCDRRDLVVKNEITRSRFGFLSKADARKVLEGAERLRNKLAHSQADLETGDSWTSILDLIPRIIDSLHQSDRAVEQLPAHGEPEQSLFGVAV